MKLVKPAKGFALVAILIIAALVIGVSATLGYKKLTTKPSPSPSPTPVTQSTSPGDLSSETSVKEESANWKIFQSNSGRFSIKYPSDWLEIHMGDTASYAENVAYGPGIKGITEDSNIKVWIQVQKNHGPNGTAPYPSAKGYVDANFKNAKDSPIFLSNKIDETTIGGLKGYRLTTSYSNGFSNALFAVDKNDFVYVISGRDPGNVDQILSTFQFLN